MKILVTGGAGFIGSNLVRLLIQKGHEVTVLDDLSSGYLINLDPFPEVHFINGDIRDTKTVNQSVKGAEIIFHMAASVGNTRSIENPVNDSEINLIGTLRILETARKHNIKKIVFSSSAGIFGELKTLPISESHPTEPISPYGASKLAAEKMSLVYNQLHNLEVICLRYFNVYGPNQRYDAYGNVIPIFAYRMIKGMPVEIYGDGEQTRDFANVRDVARANYQAALSPGVSGVFNIGSATKITINNLIKLMSEVSGINPVIEHGPPRKGDVRHSLADISASQQAFRFKPEVTMKEGLAEYMIWAKQEFGGR